MKFAVVQEKSSHGNIQRHNGRKGVRRAAGEIIAFTSSESTAAAAF
jgi:hypothetical protein